LRVVTGPGFDTHGHAAPDLLKNPFPFGLAEVAGSLKSLEAVANALDRTPESVAVSAKRLVIYHLKPRAKKASRN
jgi:hypothetical protein